jgi:hypothetical protein
VLRQTREQSHGSRMVDSQPESPGDAASNWIGDSQLALGEPIEQCRLREVVAFLPTMV